MCAKSLAWQECLKRIEKLEKNVKRKENEKYAKKRIGITKKREPRN